MWILYGLAAGIVFGVSDVITKLSLRATSPLILSGATYAGSLLVWPFLWAYRDASIEALEPVIWVTLSFAAIKAVLLCISVFLTFAAIGRLSLSTSAAIRGSGLVWPAVGGVIFYGQLLTVAELTAIALVIVSYLWIAFRQINSGDRQSDVKWSAWMLIGVFLAGVNVLIDKAALGRQVDPVAYQFVSDAFCFLIFLTAIGIRYGVRSGCEQLVLIPKLAFVVGIGFTGAELLYLIGLSYPNAQIGIASLLRRASVIVSVLASIWIFRDFSPKRDLPALSCMLSALILLLAFK